MAGIQDYLNQIKNAIYGKDVRQAIHDGIQQCYYDGKAGTIDLLARQEIAELVAPSGEAPSAAEVTDARIGADGTTYTSLGLANRTQFTDLKSDLNFVGKFDIVNLLNPADIQTGKLCNRPDLVPTENSSYNLAIVPVKAGQTYTLRYGDVVRFLSDASLKYRFVCFADANHQGGFSVLNGEQIENHGEFTVPSGASFAYVTAYSERGTKIMVLKGDVGGATIPYIPYGTKFTSKLTRSDITDLSVAGKNLVDANASVDGFLYGNGTITSSTIYKTTDFIPVEANKTYTLSPRERMYELYGSYKELLAHDRTERQSAYQVTPSQDGYMRVTYFVGDAFMIEEGSTASDYEAYKKTFNNGILLNEEQLSQVEDIIGFAQDELSGKKWCVCGDSFSYGGYSPMNIFDDGKYAGARKVYPYYIGNRTDIDIVDFTAGGRTLAYPADGTFHNSLTDPNADCYYQNIPSDTDYITIYLGINDSHHENGQGGDGEDPTGIIPLGAISDNTVNTYYGAWNVVLTWLITNRPFAHIGIIVSNGCDRAAYRTAQIEIARKYGIPFIDLNGDDRTPVMIRSQNADIASAVRQAVTRKQAVDYDGSQTGSVNTHPNDAAHEYESYFIENFLRTI